MEVVTGSPRDTRRLIHRAVHHLHTDGYEGYDSDRSGSRPASRDTFNSAYVDGLNVADDDDDGGDPDGGLCTERSSNLADAAYRLPVHFAGALA